jgi:hypothetical protein
MRKRDEDFLISEGNGFISRDEIVLASDPTPYESGHVVVKGGSKYSKLASDTTLTGSITDDVAIVARYVDATAADRPAAAITRTAEVLKDALVVDVLDVDDVIPSLAASGIIAR